MLGLKKWGKVRVRRFTKFVCCWEGREGARGDGNKMEFGWGKYLGKEEMLISVLWRLTLASFVCQEHVRREAAAASAAARPQRNPWKEVPLTGCEQSSLPTYRLAGGAFKATGVSKSLPFMVGADGHITGFM